MRISDWSSYVCSSDLAPVVCVNISRRRAHAEDPAWREDRLDFETLDPGVASVLKRGTDAALDLDLDTFVVRVECRCIDLQHPIKKLRRSEEHTSELQSLMRISYAVFCLKKKTIHKAGQHLHKRRRPQHSNQGT